jgi:hypothetical protein
MAFGGSGVVVVGAVAVGGSTLLQGPGAEEYIRVEFDFVEVVVVVGVAAAGDMGFASVEAHSSWEELSRVVALRTPGPGGNTAG